MEGSGGEMTRARARILLFRLVSFTFPRSSDRSPCMGAIIILRLCSERPSNVDGVFIAPIWSFVTYQHITGDRMAQFEL